MKVIVNIVLEEVYLLKNGNSEDIFGSSIVAW